MEVARLKPEDPFALTYAPVQGQAFVDAALEALSFELAYAFVPVRTAQVIVKGAAERNALPRQPPSNIDAHVLQGAVVSDRQRKQERAAEIAAARRIDIDPPPPPSEQERLTLSLAALVRSSFHKFIYDEDTGELDAVWSETTELMRLPIGGEPRDLQKAVTHRIGSLDTFARRAHEKAKKVDVLRALQDLAVKAPRRSRDSEDSESVQLVDAILQHRIWRAVGGTSDAAAQGTILTKPGTGYEQRPDQRANVAMRVIDLKGVHESDGVAMWEDARTKRRLLVVQFSALAGKLQAPQFRQKRALQLRDLFLKAPGALPGYYSPDALRKHFRTARTNAIDLDQFDRASGKDADVSSTGHQDGHSVRIDSGDSGDSNVRKTLQIQALASASLSDSETSETVRAIREAPLDMFADVAPESPESIRSGKRFGENLWDINRIRVPESPESIESVPSNNSMWSRTV